MVLRPKVDADPARSGYNAAASPTLVGVERMKCGMLVPGFGSHGSLFEHRSRSTPHPLTSQTEVRFVLVRYRGLVRIALVTAYDLFAPVNVGP